MVSKRKKTVSFIWAGGCVVLLCWLTLSNTSAAGKSAVEIARVYKTMGEEVEHGHTARR